MRTYPQPSRTARATIVFAATFLGLVVAGAVGMRYVPELEATCQEVPALRPPDSSWFSVFYRGGTQLDHTILWNGIGPSIENARRADVLFLGTSQMQFALPAHEIRAFERRTGLSAFSLALPFGEAYGFPLRMIEKFDLRPKLIVANATGFVRPFESAAGAQIREDGHWTGLTTVWEERLAERVWPLASRVLPSFVATRMPQALLRSSTNGAWMPVDWPHTHLPVGIDTQPLEWDPPSARRIRSTLAARGIPLVVTCVPSAFGQCRTETMMALAGNLAARVVLPRITHPLWTADVAHLCPLSGKIFGHALLRDLATVDIVRAAAKEKRKAGRQTPPG